jgi:competence protein ComEA
MFNEKEKKGIVLLLIILLVFILVSWMRTWDFHSDELQIINNSDKKTIKLIELKSGNKTSYPEFNAHSYSRKAFHDDLTKEVKLSEFNPNTITDEQLINMGINERAAGNWQKYLDKGGKFYKKEDIMKIYGITPNVYKTLSPYILIQTQEKKSISSDSAVNITNNSEFNVYRKKEKFVVDINTCSEPELMELNGIGEKLSARIIKYRDKLGGFVRIEQLKEVYGLPPETFELIRDQIVVDSKMINKIRINLAEPHILYSFPYISKREAYQIFNYRKQHGYFRSIDDLRKIKSLDETFIQKIEPYLDFGE